MRCLYYNSANDYWTRIITVEITLVPIVQVDSIYNAAILHDVTLSRRRKWRFYASKHFGRYDVSVSIALTVRSKQGTTTRACYFAVQFPASGHFIFGSSELDTPYVIRKRNLNYRHFPQPKIIQRYW